MKADPGCRRGAGVRVYRTAIGRRALLRAFPFLVLALVLTQGSTPDVWGWPAVLAVLGFAGALFACLPLGTTYRIEDGVLRIRAAVRRVDIPVSRITAVGRVSKWYLFHPADSAFGTKVVEVDEGGWKTLVSPRDESAFVAELAEARLAHASPTCSDSVA